MKRCIAIAYVVVFILLFIAPVCTYELFGSYFDQTNYEQRQAAQMPAFSLSSIDKYPQAFELYYNDNLPYRNQMISLNAWLNLHLFNRSAVDKVILGKENWLFFNPAGTDGDAIADYYGSNLLSQEDLKKLADNLVAIKNTLEAQGKEFVVTIIPNKVCLYGKLYLPAGYETENNYTIAAQVTQYLSEHTDLKVVYPKEDILTAQNNDPDHLYYYKTDTHWNNLGAYIGTRKLLQAVGIQLPALDTFEITVEEKISGDLAAMLSLASSMKHDDKYVLKDFFENTNVGQFYPIEGKPSSSCSSTTNADERSLLMVRDSFGEAMIPYLSTQFNECTFIYKNDYAPSVLAQYPSDIVVLEVVERYISNLLNFKIE